MTKESPGDRLNENQRRRLALRFSRLIEEAEELRGLLDGGAEDAALARELDRLVGMVRETAGRLEIELDREAADPRSQIEFWAAVWWTRVLDCRPSRLRGAGAVDPEVAAILEPAVERMARQLTRLRGVASRSTG